MHHNRVISLRPVVTSLTLLAAFAVGCSDDPAATPDASTPLDVTQPDASTPDASTPDVTQPDANTPDATQPDASTPDATTPDATTPDASTPDASTPDASVPDASVPAVPVVVAVSPTGHDRFFGVTYDATGAFYAVGVASDGTATTDDFRTLVVKFNADGTRASGFGTNGVASHNIVVGTTGEVARGVALQPGGRVVALATVEHPGAEARDRDVALVRFNTDGTRDTTFGTNGVVTLDLSTGEVSGTSFVADSAWNLVAYSDGRLLISASQKRSGATDSDFAIVRLNADGTRDATFGTDGVTTVDINNRNASPRAVTLLDDGSIIGSGYMDDGGVVKPVLFKLDARGARVATFGTNGVFAPTVLAAATEVYGIALQGTSFITAGYGRNAATESLDWLSLRVSATGTLDTTWATNGIARLDVAMFNDNARGITALPDGRVMIIGGGRPTETNIDGMLAVLTTSGQPDTTFAPGGKRLYDFGGASDFFWGVALSPSRAQLAVVGVRGVAAGMGNDDGVVLVMPVP